MANTSTDYLPINAADGDNKGFVNRNGDPTPQDSVPNFSEMFRDLLGEIRSTSVAAQPGSYAAQSRSTSVDGGTPQATELTITANGQSFTVTDPAMIAQIQQAAEQGDFATIANLLGPIIVQGSYGEGLNFELPLTPEGVPIYLPGPTQENDGTTFENATGTTVAGEGGNDYTLSFDHESFIFDIFAGPIADSVHYDVTLDFTYPVEPAAPPVTGTTVALPNGQTIEVDYGDVAFTAEELEALQNFDWAGAGGGNGRQFEAKMRGGLGDQLTDKVLAIGVIEDGALLDVGIFGHLSPQHSTGWSPYGWLGLDGTGIGADINAVANAAPVAPSPVTGTMVTLADGTQWEVDFRGEPLTADELAKIENFNFAGLGVAPSQQQFDTALRAGLGDELVDKLLGIKIVQDGVATTPVLGAILARNAGSHIPGDGFSYISGAGFGSDLSAVLDFAPLASHASHGRNLREVDGQVTGATEEEREFDASTERVAVLWQGLMSITGGDLPEMSAKDVFSYVAGVYLGPDGQFTQEQMATFLDANIDSSGNLKSTLDLSMFEGVDPAKLQNVFTDGAQLFYSVQANRIDPNVGGRDITDTEGPALIFAPTEGVAEAAFGKALQAEVLQNGTTEAASSTTWQDVLASGITSQDSVLNGHFTEDDLKNDSLVKAILWVGADVIAELEGQGLWTGPSAADLDQATLAEDHPLYDVVYTRDGETVHVVATQEEFDVLVQQHKDGEIKLDTSNILSDYAVAPDNPEVGAEQYKLTYIDNATGKVVVKNELSPAQHADLVARHESGDIIILPPKIEDPNLVKLLWVEKALAVYGATQAPVYDANGNVISGGNTEARIAQAYVLYYEYNSAAAETESYGPGRTGTRLEPLLQGGPTDTRSSMTDGKAIAFMNTSLGLGSTNGPVDVYDYFSRVEGITDIVHVAGHWAQNRALHPDHTAGEWLGGGNKEQAGSTAALVRDFLLARGRSTATVDAVLADADREIFNSRVLTGLTIAFNIVTLGADAAALSAARAMAAEVGLEFTAEEGASLLEQSFTTSATSGQNPTLKAALWDLVEDGALTKDQAVQILSRQAGSGPEIWHALGASGAGYATAGAVGLDVFQAGMSGNVVPISTTGDATPTVANEGGLSMKEQLAAIDLAAKVSATSANVGLESAGALLFGDHGYSAAVIEQVLELLPTNLRNELTAYRDSFQDDGKLSSLIASGDTAGLTEYIQSLPSTALQYDALVAIESSGQPILMLRILQSLPPEAAANILIYEQSVNLNSTQSIDGAPANPLDTSGPLINTLFDVASTQPEAFKADFGAIFAKVAEISPDLGAHILHTAYNFRDASDGSAKNPGLAFTIVASVDEESALKLLNALDELQADNGPRRLGGGDLPGLVPIGDSGFEFQSVEILLYGLGQLATSAVVSPAGEQLIELATRFFASGDYQNSAANKGQIEEYKGTSAAAAEQIEVIRGYLADPFTALDGTPEGLEFTEELLADFGYDKASELLNNMSPEQAAAYLDQLSLPTFERLIAGMDVESALEVLPFLAANQNIVQGEARQQYIDRLSDLTGVDPEMIGKLFDGTITMEEMEQSGAYAVIAVLYDKLQAGDATAIQYINDAVDTLIAAGGGGDDPGGWNANDIAILEDLRDAATGTGSYAGIASPEALATLLTLLGTGIGAAFQAVNELADLKFIPEAVEEMGLEGLVEQNPELAALLEDPEALQKEYLNSLNETEEGRHLLESTGYMVIDGELYHAPRGLQNTTDIPSGQPSGQPSGEPSGQPSEEPSWHPSLRPSNPPSGAPSVAASNSPTKATAAETDAWFQEHGRFDLAVEVNLFVGPGATVRQFRAFVHFNGARDEHGNMKFGLRFRQLSAVAPEGTFGTVARAISYTANGAAQTLNYINPNWVEPLQNAFRSVGTGANSFLGIFQSIGLPARGDVWAADVGFVSVQDFKFNFLGFGAKDDKGNNIAGFKPEFSYGSSISFATEAGNAENSAPYQIANFIRNNFGGESDPYPGTDIAQNEVVSYRHAESNLNSATSNYNSAATAMRDYILQDDTLGPLYQNVQARQQDFEDAANGERLAWTDYSQKLDELQAAQNDAGAASADVSAASDALDLAQANHDVAVANKRQAQENYDALLSDGNDPGSQPMLDAREQLDAANTAYDASWNTLDAARQTYQTAVANEGVQNSNVQTLLGEAEVLREAYNTSQGATAEARIQYMEAASEYDDFRDSFYRNDPEFANLQNAQDRTAGEYTARYEQFELAQEISDSANAGLRLFNTVANNVDTEAGAGFGWGATYSAGSTDATTGEYVRDPNFIWKVGGEILTAAAGGFAVNYLIQSWVARSGTRLNTFREINQDVGGINQFLAGLMGNTTASQNQGPGLLAGYAIRTVYSALASKYADNVDQASEFFSWFALQWRGKFSDTNFPVLGAYTGKAGGRFQVNYGQELSVE
jgi:hypothetical protein